MSNEILTIRLSHYESLKAENEQLKLELGTLKNMYICGVNIIDTLKENERLKAEIERIGNNFEERIAMESKSIAMRICGVDQVSKLKKENQQLKELLTECYVYTPFEGNLRDRIVKVLREE